MASFRTQAAQRLEGMRTTRNSWWLHWRELADYILPRRYRWLVTPNQWGRGSPLNQHIIDSTGTIAARVLASGMMSGITSPTRPWFKLRLAHNHPADPSNAISLWLAECEKRILRVLQESNFYNAMATVYADLVVFGTAVMLIYEDFDDVIHCYNPCAGEYFLGNSSKMRADTLYREFTFTVAQTVDEFGEENVSETVRSMYRNGGANLTFEVVICHAIEPNTPGLAGSPPAHFALRELYWEKGSRTDQALRTRGYYEWPGFAVRWDLVSNDAYGRSPAMDALGDIKQLQQETRRKAQAIDKMVNPPLVADVQLKNQPASTLPGGLTFVNGLDTGRVGIKPIYTVAPPVVEMMQDIKEIQERVRTTFFNDLFMMISNLQTVRSATEIDARREEKLVLLGPVLERIQNEALDPVLDRVFGIMTRLRLLPPPPPDIAGQPIQIQYISMLAEAQKAVATSGYERLWQVAGNLAGAAPSVLDNINFDDGIQEYSTLLGNSPKAMNAPDVVAQKREQRVKQQQQQELLQQTLPAVQGAQTLSKTDLGGGQNALQAMINGAQQ